MKFIRFGGLSPVKYKKDHNRFGKFHTPPRRYGLFAFIYPYHDDFLWAWKVRSGNGEFKKNYDMEYKRRRIFEYDGMIWTHLSEKTSSSWDCVHTDELKDLFRKTFHMDIKDLNKSFQREIIINPYKRGLNGFMSIDHLEVFIEKKHCGKIK